MAVFVVDVEKDEGEKKDGKHQCKCSHWGKQGFICALNLLTYDRLPHVLIVKFGDPVVIGEDCAFQQEEVQSVDEDEAEGEIEKVHQNLAEELRLKPQSVQLLREGVLAEVEESRIRTGCLVVNM